MRTTAAPQTGHRVNMLVVMYRDSRLPRGRGNPENWPAIPRLRVVMSNRRHGPSTTRRFGQMRDVECVGFRPVLGLYWSMHTKYRSKDVLHHLVATVPRG